MNYKQSKVEFRNLLKQIQQQELEDNQEIQRVKDINYMSKNNKVLKAVHVIALYEPEFDFEQYLEYYRALHGCSAPEA